jgi:choline dehydrogenase-like flavoprotein
MIIQSGQAGLRDEYDYIVVGSGAGGGPVASNLARQGYDVLILEAGGNDEPIDYQVPAFHALSTEHNDLAWKFYVQHYEDPQRQRADKRNYVDYEVDEAPRRGIFYPRAGTLGGCTAHHAMICIYPHNRDWDYVAELTGDGSWSAAEMRKYFERLERCGYVTRGLDILNLARHGFGGWLHTHTADPLLLTRDLELAELVFAAAGQSLDDNVSGPIKFIERVWARLESRADPNDWRRVKEDFEGVTLTPLTIRNGRRYGTRELILDTMQNFPAKLTVKLHALATKVNLDVDKRAVGVEFLDGAHLYRVDPKTPLTGDIAVPRISVCARKEVVLSGGTFNTPQILMLSGIGPAEELRALGIDPKIDLPQVGRNLQDRYEVGIVHKMKHDFAILRDASFVAPAAGQPGDAAYQEWHDHGKGLYATNGAVIAIIKRADKDRPDPDLYMFAVPGHFSGYRPGYSELPRTVKDEFTWVILKGHTKNTAGWVHLRSTDPRDPPDINFKYFDEGNDQSGDDLRGVVAGVECVRAIAARTPHLFKAEMVPGPDVITPTQIADFVKSNAWGHHACGTCRIGREGESVLDSRFRVWGTKGLRVVDASVFPRIPGLFILSAVYMIAEKASDAILEDAEDARATHKGTS